MGSRPALGALMRQRAASEAVAPPASPDPVGREGDGAVAGSAAREPADTPASEAPRPPARLDRDTVVQAWGDHVLRSLPARAKALYSAGRFVSVDGTTATFALPNAAHRDRCDEVRRTVEEGLSAHFGTKVTLQLTVDNGVGGSDPTGSAGPAPVDPDGPDEDPGEGFAPDAEVETGSVETMVQARVLDAFPGAEEMTE